MWFKQAQIFNLSAPVLNDPHALEEQLTPLEFNPCLPRLPFSTGWVSPMDEEEAPLVHANHHYLLLCMQLEEKILPAIVVRQALAEKIKDIEKKQSRTVYQKEKYALKDEITQTLLPRAFSKLSRIYAFMDVQNNVLVIDTTATFKVEKFLELFKKTFGNASYHSVETKKIGPSLTRWLLHDDCPRSFSIEKACVLRDPRQQSRVIRCQQQDLSAAGIQSLLKDACEVHQLSLNWEDKINFTLLDDFTLKSIQYTDEVLALAEGHDAESKSQQFDADFAILSELLSLLWKQLVQLFGVKAESQTHERQKALA